MITDNHKLKSKPFIFEQSGHNLINCGFFVSLQFKEHKGVIKSYRFS